MTGTLRVPGGDLVRSRVVADPATALATVLDRRLTGYAVLEPQETLLLDGDARGILTFEDGVPAVAYHTATGAGGPEALAALAEPGPFRVDLYRVPADELADAHRADALAVPPGMPAERLGGDADLADRTREVAPEDRRRAGEDADPVAAFLDDERKIEAIREQARERARKRAEEWGLEAQLADR